MLKGIFSLLLILSLNTLAKDVQMKTIYDIKVKTINGEETTLEQYKGNVMLIVNVASKCGYTPQYDGLETLYKKYKDEGLVVLGFPCNQFGSQEPGSEAEIQNFCRVNFGVTFPMFSKINVNGEETHPLYQYLKSEQPGILGTEAIKWNFTKFLVDKEGNVVKRFGSSTKPKELEEKIEALLK
jgi:glutathione peroxidase